MEQANRLLGAELRAEIRSLSRGVIDAAAWLSPDESNHEESLGARLHTSTATDSLDQEVLGDITAHLRDFSGKVLELHETGRSTRQIQTTLASLYFPHIRERQKRIPRAHTKTFQWILESAIPDQSTPLKFVDWLEKQTGIFWIQGKPGSGKSTLMKFICDHEDTQHRLVLWAGGRKLVMGKFFFWYAGSPLQKSREGLLRSLLFEILRQCPSLVPRVYELHSRLQDNYRYDDWSWTSDDLLSVCCDLLLCATEHCFCFFIDGLDEYQEGRMTSSDLINIVKSLDRSPNVKLCVSSRPWSAFTEAFGQNTDLQLRVQDLTRGDIQQYVSDKFNESLRFRKLRTTDSSYSHLVETICQRSSGVFLWVFLAVRDQLDGFTNGDSISLLQDRLDRLPEDLDEFFQHMLAAIPSIYLKHTARILDIAKLAAEPQSAMAISFVDEVTTNVETVAKLPSEPMEEAEISFREDQVRRQLDARSKGLLEITSDKGYEGHYFQMKVDFLHRTVRDFLDRSDGSRVLQGRLEQPSTALIMCRALVATLKRAPRETFQDEADFENLVRTLFRWASRVEHDRGGIKELPSLLSVAERAYLERSQEQRQRKDDLFFLKLTCQSGINSFFEVKLADGNIPTALKMSGRPILDHALYENEDVCPSFVEALLKRGADPNQAYGLSTPWGRFMEYVYRNADNLEADNIRDVTKMLVEHGANLDEAVVLTRLERDDSDPIQGIQRRPCLYGSAAWSAYSHGVASSRRTMSALQVIELCYGEQFAAFQSSQPRGFWVKPWRLNPNRG